MQKPRLRRCSTHWPAIFESSEIDTFHRYVLTYASSQCRLKTGHGKIAKQALFVVASHTLHSSFACLHALCPILATTPTPQCLLLNVHASTLHICGSSQSGLSWSHTLRPGISAGSNTNVFRFWTSGACCVCCVSAEAHFRSLCVHGSEIE